MDKCVLMNTSYFFKATPRLCDVAPADRERAGFSMAAVMQVLTASVVVIEEKADQPYAVATLWKLFIRHPSLQAKLSALCLCVQVMGVSAYALRSAGFSMIFPTGIVQLLLYNWCFEQVLIYVFQHLARLPAQYGTLNGFAQLQS